MDQKFSSIDEYIASLPEEVQIKAQDLRKIIRDSIPEAREVISYNMPTFKLDGISAIYFAVWKKHISLYPFSDSMMPLHDKNSTYEISGKGTIQFPLDQPLPETLIRKIIAARLEEMGADNK